MAPSNRDRAGQAFELFATGFGPYVDRMMRVRSGAKEQWLDQVRMRERGPVSLQDPSFQLKVAADYWDTVFRHELTRSDRNLVYELRDMRNRWAHNQPFTVDDVYRALDSMERLLTAVQAPEAAEIGRSKDELMRLRYQAEVSKAAVQQDIIVTAAKAGLKPWRQVIDPHEDVLEGRFSLAEFAADLHQVSLRKGSPEYSDPVEFFARTYLTGGLRTLLEEATKRLTGSVGAPIIDLQSTFGGGKTHSEIALWHLFSGTAVARFPTEVRDLLAEADVTGDLPAVRRVALVGSKLAPGQPSVKDDGTRVHTMWGELAWRLGGREGYELIADADTTATNPGENLDLLLSVYSPCLILIDEWVSYARQLLTADNLPAGTFDTHFSFAQALTEAVRATPRTLLVLSLPASPDNDRRGGSSEVELGGPGGREALRRLRNVIGRVESPWRPASSGESFEIVRRRLFKPIQSERIADRDETARAFRELYRRESAEFPAGCREPGYVEQIKAAYPVHPELFARLYEDWSTLDRFQLTRGVLRLMAAVIHALYEGGDQSPVILPASVPLAHPAVAAELAGNLDDNWQPIIDTDIDGPDSTPVRLDKLPNLGRYQAARRVARTVFLGSAPNFRSPNRGIDAARVRLGCAMPGETLAAFGDALSRMPGQMTYFYADAGRYWYAVQPTVGRLARERAEQLLNEARDEIHAEIVRRLRMLQRDPGDFRGVHPAPATPGDVPDDSAARLVVLGPALPHLAHSDDSSALAAAREVLDNKGGKNNDPRDYRNCLVFLAADNRRLDELEAAVAEYLAWSWIHDESGADGLNLDPIQAAKAGTSKADANTSVGLRLSEAYQWLLVPSQPEPKSPMSWDEIRVDGQGSLAARAARKLVDDGHLYTGFPPSLLRQRLETSLARFWEPGHVEVRTVWQAFARYLYLPRLRDLDVLLACVATGAADTSWQQEGFAIADGFDGSRYLALTAGSYPAVSATTLIVRPECAAEQLSREQESTSTPGPENGSTPDGKDGETEPTSGEPSGHSLPQRFHGVIRLDPTRLNRDFGKVTQEVVANLTGLLGAEVDVTVEIAARRPDGFPDSTVRNVTENSKTLGFEDGSGFEDR